MQTLVIPQIKRFINNKDLFTHNVMREKILIFPKYTILRYNYIFTFEILNAMAAINHRKIGKATAVSLLGVHCTNRNIWPYSFGQVERECSVVDWL